MSRTAAKSSGGIVGLHAAHHGGPLLAGDAGQDPAQPGQHAFRLDMGVDLLLDREQVLVGVVGPEQRRVGAFLDFHMLEILGNEAGEQPIEHFQGALAGRHGCLAGGGEARLEIKDALLVMEVILGTALRRARHRAFHGRVQECVFMREMFGAELQQVGDRLQRSLRRLKIDPAEARQRVAHRRAQALMHQMIDLVALGGGVIGDHAGNEIGGRRAGRELARLVVGHCRKSVRTSGHNSYLGAGCGMPATMIPRRPQHTLISR
jgi:hypothetical protein